MTPNYDTKLFCDIYPDAQTFIADYNSVGIETTISNSSAKTLFFLLYARHGNDPIANRDQNQFKYKLFATVWQFGPTWEKKVELQKKIREISDEELLIGSTSINNRSLNPSSAPSTSTTEELETINEQSTNKVKRSKLDAYSILTALLMNDVTEEFITRFNALFKTFVMPERPTLYYDEGI